MINTQWAEVRSGKLLRRLASRDLIVEPPECQRPKQPSKRVWGKGYHYVTPIDGRPKEWDFEGSHFQIIQNQKDHKFYVWKRNIENSSLRLKRR